MVIISCKLAVDLSSVFVVYVYVFSAIYVTLLFVFELHNFIV